MLPEVIQAVDKKAGRYPPVSIPDYEDLRLRTSSLQGLAGYWRAPRHIDIDGEPVEVGSEFVTDNYFDVLEVRPLIGRSFEPGDNTGPGGRPVVMLSERLWSNRFARDPALVGRQVRLDTEPFDVIGIVPATYGRDHNVFWQTPPEIWLPSATYARFMAPGEFDVIARRRGAGILQLFGRLTPAATIRQTQAELETIITTLPRATGSLAGANIEVVPAGRAKFYPGYRQSFSRRLALVGLIGALVLVLACSNLANLLLERTTRRRRELALRASIGAGRSRLIRQLLTESLVIGVPGFAASLLVAHLLLRLVSAYPLALGVPVDLDLHLTGRIVLLCLLTCLAVVIAFSLVPVLRTTRGNLAESASLRDGDVGGRSRLTHALVATQVALCAVLLVGTFLITRAVASAQSMDLGFQTDRLIGLTQRRSPGIRGDKELVPMGVLDPERWNVPGIEAAAMASPSPLHGWTSDGLVNDASTPLASPPRADQVWVTPGFFDVTQVRFVAGRDFAREEGIDPAGDDTENPAAQVVIVSQDLAERLWGRQPAVGRLITGFWDEKPSEVVGVVANARYVNLWNPPRPMVYRPLSATSPWGEILIRTTAPPAALVPEVARAWRAMSPDLRAFVRTGSDYVVAASESQRLISRLIAAFAALALTVASIGLYSAMAWLVERRRREMALRLAVGGSPMNIASSVLRRSALVGGAGAIAGLAIAALLAPHLDTLTRAAASYDGAVSPATSSPYDILAFVAAALTIATICLAAAAVPAARAARVDPVTVLKSE